MNDPGLDDPISNNAKVVESQKELNERDEAEENEQAFLDPR
jgi:potassium channel subfamily K, other eukaryote